MNPKTKFTAFRTAMPIQARAKETNSAVTVTLLPCAGTKKLRYPTRGSVELAEPSTRKNMIPELMRARPDARLIIEPGRLKFFTTIRATVMSARSVSSERKVGSANPVCVIMELVCGMLSRA